MKPRRATHNGNTRWIVQYTEGTRRRRKIFATKTEAQNWIAAEEAKAERLGHDIAEVASDDFTREAVSLARRLDDYGATLSDAVEFFIARREAEGASLKLRDLIATFQKAKASQGLAPRTLQDLRSRLNTMSEYFGPEIKVAAISTPTIESWLDGLQLSAQSANHYRRVAHGFLEWCVDRGYATDNPAKKVAKRKVVREDPKVFTPEQFDTLLASADDPQLVAWIALGGLAGLRSSEITRLDWKHVHVGEGVIDLSSTATKKNQRRIVEICPRLSKILTDIKQLGGPVVSPRIEESRLLRSFRAALPFEWPHNGLRHSYGTYHLAAFENAAKTALQMGHRDVSTFFEHYNRPGIRKNVALRWWAAGVDTTGKAVDHA